MSAADVFITGMARSGTTLLEKMLANHPQLSMISQPFPRLFLHAKRQFVESLGQTQPLHALEHLFRNHRYQDLELDEFLAQYRVSHATLCDLFEEMKDDRGQWTSVMDLDALLEGLESLHFVDVIRALNRRMAHRDDARGFGSKEIRCEEFLPHLLGAGFRCLVVLRDPRDVIASMNFGNGEHFVGAPRPVLFDLRMWRKSVAYALYYREHPHFRCVRYEDLVTAPLERVQGLAAWLGLESFPSSTFRDGLRDQSGSRWKGNSSHSESSAIHTHSVGAHQSCLDDDLLRFVETVCYPEMCCLGYKAVLDDPDPDFLSEFRERTGLRVDDLPADYSSSPCNVEAERERLREWQHPTASGEVAASLFHFARVARILHEARSER